MYKIRTVCFKVSLDIYNPHVPRASYRSPSTLKLAVAYQPEFVLCVTEILCGKLERAGPSPGSDPFPTDFHGPKQYVAMRIVPHPPVLV